MVEHTGDHLCGLSFLWRVDPSPPRRRNKLIRLKVPIPYLLKMFNLILYCCEYITYTDGLSIQS